MSYLDMINPDKVSTVQGDGISTPNVLRVQVRDMNILDNDVAGAADHLKTLPLQNSRATRADK